MEKTWLKAALLAAALSLGTARAGEEAGNWNKFKEGVKQAGEAVAKGAKNAGRSVASGARKTGEFIADGYEDAKEYVQEKTAKEETDPAPDGEKP
ncbi:MAG: hypothetical protein LBV15_06160 [Planctomycetota bacterium]|jgi:hypothetical protein|nr:hypothetical protein [Planctomycetota bacterium]